ncbi:MAG: ABC transporter permease [Lentisphaeria bacterium]|nr:ABC transporter permease [Lentisphaeria bacterium]
MLSPQLRSGLKRFRRQRRAFWSLGVITILFVVCLPAELLCNSKPIFIRFNGRSYFPVFKRYTEADFGGARHVVPDYRSPGFLELVGHGEPHGEGDQAVPTPPPPPATDVLDMFDDETSGEPGPGRPADGGGKENSAAAAARILADFDPEPWDVEVTERCHSTADEAVEPAWMLWPPVRYDYAYIAQGSQAGRDALASPWGQVIPGSGKHYGSSWVDGHYLGTDDRGRDVLARLVYGFRVSMIFGLALAISGTIAGAVIGALQGFFGGLIDLLGQRVTEIWGSLPQLYLLMILSSLLARNIYVLFVILNLTSWMGMAAYMRAEFLRGRQLDYVLAARGLGVSSPAIMFRHILPNSLTPIITFLPFSISGGILALVSLDFLSLGVPSPYPSLGELLAQGQNNLRATWIIFPTFLVLSGTVTLLTFVGDGLRNAFDPRKSG